MSNEVAVIQNKNHSLSKWENEEFMESVKESYSKDLSKTEFTLFIEMGKALNLNPFLREIWAVKYGTTPAQIFIGRDGYRKAAQRDPDYEYHYCDAVYENDDFTGEEGIYHHKFTIKNRGRLVGAYCKVKRKSVERPFCVFVTIEEYDKGTSTWKTMKPTMIKKVSESHCLRMAFQDAFAGTYAEEEIWDERQKYDYKKEEQKKLDEEKKKLEEQKNKLEEQKNKSIQKNTIDVSPLKDKEEQKKPHIATHLEETDFNKIALFKNVNGMALQFNIDFQQEKEFILQICREVMAKKPLISKIDECIRETFEEHLKAKE